RDLDRAQGRLGADRADHLCRAREPAEDRARQGRAHHQGDRRGFAPRARRDHRAAGPPVPVRQGARGLGQRSGALPADGAGISQGVSMARAIALALLFMVHAAQAQDRGVPLHTNEAELGELRPAGALAITDTFAVFSYVLNALPERVNVLPTENYYYVRF